MTDLKTNDFNKYWDNLLFGATKSDKCVAEQVFAHRTKRVIELECQLATSKKLIALMAKKFPEVDQYIDALVLKLKDDK